ncbi:MAG: BF3164 family lipoprotein [Sediminibacterium sp.]|nr:BF3164 family lipoprotein [Sediminibacterium sp.]MDP1811925.1 BF3164 family lipoprotein [Sediminibacterium sp.]
MLGIILTGCMFFFTNCDNIKQSTNKDTIVFQKFPKVSELSFQDFLKFDQGTPYKLYLMDSSLIVCNWQIRLVDYYFYQYSLKNRNLTGRYIAGGRGPGQALNAFSSGLYKKNTIWLHDISLNKVLTTSLKKNADGSDSLVFHDYQLPRRSGFYYSVQLMDSSKLLAGGAEHTPYKIQVLDLPSGKEIAEFGSFGNVPPGIPFYAWKGAYQSLLFLKPTEEKAVQACRYADQIEIFDLHTKKSKLVKGPEKYEPEFGIMKTNVGADVMYRNDKTRFAFVNGMVTNRYIYLLYSGVREREYKMQSKCIYVYDWKGNPITKFNIDRYITGFTVSDDDTVIYAFDRNTGYIIKTPIHI